MSQSFKHLVALLTFAPVLGLACGSSAPKDNPQPLAPLTDTTPVHVNLDYIKKLVFDRSTSVLILRNQLQASKINYNTARTNLLPSLNITGAVGSFANPAFLLPEVEALLPFLMPSVWADMFTARRQYQADKETYVSREKDILADALTLYLSVLHDQSILVYLVSDLNDLRVLEDQMHSAYDNGLANANQWRVIRTQLDLASSRVQTTQRYVNDQTNQLKRAMGIDQRRQMIMDPYEWPSDPAEKWSYEQIFNQYWAKSNQRRQLEYQIASAKNGKISAEFAFISGASIVDQPIAPQQNARASANNLEGVGVLTISASQYQRVRFAGNRVESAQLYLNDLHDQTALATKNFVDDFAGILQRRDADTDAQQSGLANFDDILINYNTGLGATFQDVLNARLGIEDSELDLIEASRDLDSARVTLARWLENGPFADVPPPPGEDDSASNKNPDSSKK